MKHENDHIYDNQAQNKPLKCIRINTSQQFASASLLLFFDKFPWNGFAGIVLKLHPLLLLQTQFFDSVDQICDVLILDNDDVIENVQNEKRAKNDKYHVKDRPIRTGIYSRHLIYPNQIPCLKHNISPALQQ